MDVIHRRSWKHYEEKAQSKLYRPQRLLGQIKQQDFSLLALLDGDAALFTNLESVTRIQSLPVHDNLAARNMDVSLPSFSNLMLHPFAAIDEC